MNGTELELISDIDKYLLVGKGMRGGITYIAKRRSKANNKYMQSYDVINQANLLCISMKIIYMVGH